MSDFSAEQPSALPEVLRQVDQVCQAFEAARKAGERPLIEPLIESATDPFRRELLRELLLLEIEFRQRQGEVPCVDDYRQRFAADAELVEAVFRRVATATSGSAAGTPTQVLPLDNGGGRAVPSASAADARSLPPSDECGSYRILRPHAHGGLGEVFLAWDKNLHRTVALKRIRDDRHGNAHRERRFLIEAELTGQLEHPSIVPLYAAGQDEHGRPFYVMKLVHGPTLADAIAEYHRRPAPLAFHDLLRRFVAICQAVAFAHKREVIHRDLKPANVMLGEYGETLVVDWGLAKRVGQSADGPTVDSSAVAAGDDAGLLTRQGDVLGTPAYMAPEQAAGNAARIGSAADVYSLGAILYTILSGKSPYHSCRGSTPAELHTHPPERPSQITRGVPRPLEAVCSKAMARSPDDRYASAADIARDVEHYLADEPVTAYRESAWQRAARWARRHRPLVAALAGLLMTAAVAMAVSNILISHEQRRTETARQTAEQQRQEADRQRNAAEGLRVEAEGHRRHAEQMRDEAIRLRDEAQTARSEAEQQRDQAEQQTELAEYRAYIATIGLAGRKIEDRLLADAEQLLLATPKKHRNWEWGRLMLLCRPEHRRLMGHGGAVSGGAFSPDGKRVVTVGRDGAAKIWEVETGKELLTFRDENREFNCVAWSPDGKLLATGAQWEKDARLWDVATGRRVRVLGGHHSHVQSVAFSPDGTRLVTGSWDGTARVWEVESGKQLLLLGSHYGPEQGDKAGWDVKRHSKVAIHAVAWSPDGKMIVTGSRDRTAKLWDAQSGEEIRSLKTNVWGLAAAFSLDSRYLVTAGWEKTGQVWDTQTGEAIAELSGHTGAIWAARFSRDGGTVVTAAADHMLRFWETKTGREKESLVAHSRDVVGLAVASDGNTILTTSVDGMAKLWQSPYGETETVLTASDGDKREGVHFTPDGTRIVTCNLNAEVAVWDFPQLRRVSSFSLPGRRLGVHLLSPDGRFLFMQSYVMVPNPKGRSSPKDRILLIYDVSSGKELHRLVLDAAEDKGNAVRGNTKGLVWFPDSKGMLVTFDNGTIRRWDMETGKAPLMDARLEGAVGWVGFSGDGRALACVNKSGRLHVCEVQSGKTVFILKEDAAKDQTPALSPKGDLLAVRTAKGGLVVWNIESGRRLFDLSQQVTAIGAFAFSPDSRRLIVRGATAGWEYTEDLLSVLDMRSGEEIVTLHNVPKGSRGFSFSPDGRWLAISADNKVVFWPTVDWRRSKRGQNDFRGE